MNKQDQINMLQFRIERIELHLAEQHKGNNFNLSEIPNSCEPEFKVCRGGYTIKDGVVPTPDSTHYIPQPGEVVEVSEYKDQWLRRIFIKVKLNNIFECVTQDSERYNEKYYREGDSKYLTTEWKFCRRLSGEIIEFGCDKPTQYHVAVHEAVTAEPDPYQVDWSNAPDWAELHAFDSDGKGYWYGVRVGLSGMYADSKSSGFTLPTGLDWKLSKTTRP
jgi:hypothetical protein